MSMHSYTYFQSYFLIICREICETSSYSCIEVNDKHRVYLPIVMAQNTEFFGLYRNSQLRGDVTSTSRMILCVKDFVTFSRRDNNWEFVPLRVRHQIQSFAQIRTFAQFRIIQIEEYLILLNDSAGEFKLLSEKVHSLTDIFI